MDVTSTVVAAPTWGAAHSRTRQRLFTLAQRHRDATSIRKDFVRLVVQIVAVAGNRVLVVDDEPIVREVLTRYLTKEGFAVEDGEDGESALEAVQRERPDLILLDLMLPRIDGLEVFRRLRTPDAPAVIMLT